MTLGWILSQIINGKSKIITLIDFHIGQRDKEAHYIVFNTITKKIFVIYPFREEKVVEC